MKEGRTKGKGEDGGEGDGEQKEGRGRSRRGRRKKNKKTMKMRTKMGRSYAIMFTNLTVLLGVLQPASQVFRRDNAPVSTVSTLT